MIETLEGPDERRRYLARQKSVHRVEVFCTCTLFLYRMRIWIHLPFLCGLAVLMLAEHRIWQRKNIEKRYF